MTRQQKERGRILEFSSRQNVRRSALLAVRREITKMTPICEKRIPIVLDKPRELVFNFTTLAKYEEESEKAYAPKPGKSYWDTIVQITNTQSRVAAATIAAGKTSYMWSDVLKELPMRDIRIMLHAALMEYPDSKSDPVWPLTVGQLSRYIDPQRVVEVVEAIILGHQKNSPTKEELGEASAPPPEQQPEPDLALQDNPPATNGGAASIGLLESALG